MKSSAARLAALPAPARILALLLLLLIMWLPLAVPIALTVQSANSVIIVTMALLFVEFLLLIPRWGRWVHDDPRILRRFGLVWTRQNGLDCLAGLGLGLVSVLLLFWVQVGLGWAVWQSPTVALPRIVAEGLLSALGIGLAEELLFRGWILYELQQDYRPKTVLWADSLIFACLHFLKPLAEMWRTLPQFPGLVLLGLTQVWARRSTGALGLPIGLHAGLIWGYYILHVGEMVRPTRRVSDWLTGVDGQPIAGLSGLLFLAGLALWMRSRSRCPQGSV